MPISQTYLGSIEENTKVVVYYLFESYSNFQSEFTKALMAHLSTLGKRVGEEATIFVLNPDSLAPIENEIRGIANNNEEFVKILNQKTPGLLFLDRRLIDFKSKVHPWVYVSLRPFADGQSKDRMPDFFSRIENVILNSDQVLTNIQDASRWTALYKGFKSRSMVEPNFYGMGYRSDSSKECEVIAANVDHIR